MLDRFLANTRGAHLMLMDAARGGKWNKSLDARWPEHSHAAMLRHSWNSDDGKEGMLMVNLRKAVTESGPLKQVDRGLQQLFRSLAGDPGEVEAYDSHLPEGLANLNLGVAP
ncbi:MAG: hypothetical protein N2C14_25090, partial [Planctomycetales bacterium]